MNRAALENAGIDYDFCVRRFVGRAQLFEKALGKFMKDSTAARIREARAAGDKEALFAGAHEFKGVCGNMGLTPLYEAACSLVDLMRGTYCEHELTIAYDLLMTRYDSIYKAIAASLEDA